MNRILSKLFIAFILAVVCFPSLAQVVPIQFGIKGEAQFIVKHEDGTESKFAPDHNLFTNGGMNYFGNPPGSGAGFFEAFAVSSDNTAPSVSRTVMPSPLAATGSTNWTLASIVSATAPYVWTSRNTYTFPLGAVVGNVCKFGLIQSEYNLSSALLTEGLVKVSGVPACITILSTDQLIVIYTMTMTMPAVSGTFNVVVDGVSTPVNYSILPLLGNTAEGQRFRGLGIPDSASVASCITESTTPLAITQAAGGCALPRYTVGATRATYIVDSFQRDFSMSFPAGAAKPNLRQARIALIGPMSVGVQWDTNISVSNIQSMIFTVRVTWANSTP